LPGLLRIYKTHVGDWSVITWRGVLGVGGGLVAPHPAMRYVHVHVSIGLRGPDEMWEGHINKRVLNFKGELQACVYIITCPHNILSYVQNRISNYNFNILDFLQVSCSDLCLCTQLATSISP
jgi:hypothetical protein